MTATLESKVIETLFNVQGYSLVDIRTCINVNELCEEIEIELEQNEESTCPRCGLRGNRYRHDSNTQRIYLGSMLCKAVYGVLKVFRVKCPTCGVLTDRQTISNGKARYSKAVPMMLLRYTQAMDNTAVSSLLGLSKSTVFRMDKDELTKLAEDYDSKIPPLEQIGIDEIAHRSGHNYATVITNQSDGKVVWIEPDRTTGSLMSAYERYPKRFQGIKVATMDFWRPFESATKSYHPDCKIVYDRFHLSRLVNRVIEEERRDYQNGLEKEERKFIKKHTRWVMLRRLPNCTDKQKDRLDELREANEWLYNLYLLKEDFLSVFDEPGMDKGLAREHILNWIQRVNTTAYEKLKRFAKNLLERLEKILDWFDHRISNAKAEGINNVIKTILKRGYGYSDFFYFRLKILQRCGYLMEHSTHTF